MKVNYNVEFLREQYIQNRVDALKYMKVLEAHEEQHSSASEDGYGGACWFCDHVLRVNVADINDELTRANIYFDNVVKTNKLAFSDVASGLDDVIQLFPRAGFLIGGFLHKLERWLIGVEKNREKEVQRAKRVKGKVRVKSKVKTKNKPRKVKEGKTNG